LSLTRKQRIHQLLIEHGISGDELDLMFSAIHHGVTEPIASRVYHQSSTTVNRVRDRKILISNGLCEAQLIHLDNTAPLMVTAVYLHEVDEMVPATEFFDTTNHKTGRFEVCEVDVEMKAFTRRYRPPWSQHECYNHTRNSESMVPVMSIGMFVSTLLHRGPKITSKTGLRIVLFQTCAEPTYTITREALLYQTFEFKFVLGRCMARFDQLKEETQQRYRRITYRVFTSDEYRLRWRQHVRGEEETLVNELVAAAAASEVEVDHRQHHDSSSNETLSGDEDDSDLADFDDDAMVSSIASMPKNRKRKRVSK
jgi:hypothetical protein